MRPIDQLLSEYSKSHQNATNKLIHWVCVPAIVFSIFALLWSIPFFVHINLLGVPINWGSIAIVLVTIYYFRLSVPIAFIFIVFAAISIQLLLLLQAMGCSLWATSLVVFVIAWLGQFYGHHVEGAKPSFLKDLQFLLIGPAWVFSFLLKKMGVRI